jgi:hypothetical protein
LGFSTWQEGHRAKHFLIHAPFPEVHEYLTRTFLAKLNLGLVAYVRPANPEPPTEGPTFWFWGDRSIWGEAPQAEEEPLPPGGERTLGSWTIEQHEAVKANNNITEAPCPSQTPSR